MAQSIRRNLLRLIEAGTDEYAPDDRSGLIIANLTGYLASLSSIAFAASFAFHDPNSLRPLILGNLISAGCTAATPFFHRFGRIAAAIWLAVILCVSLVHFTSLLGRDSGVVLNLIATSAVAFAILGIKRFRIVLLISMISAGAILFSWSQYPKAADGIYAEPDFLQQIFATTIISNMLIILVVVYYAFSLTEQAQAQTDGLLRAIMPDEIVDRLKRNPGQTLAEQYDSVPVLFADMVGFTELSNRLGPERIVLVLDRVFRSFDELAKQHGVEKIKTIGDAYMAVCGIPSPHATPIESILNLAIDMHRATVELSKELQIDVSLRIGIAQGSISAGVVGQAKYFFDVWGPTVNLAARLQTAAQAGQTLVSKDVFETGQVGFDFEESTESELKGFGKRRLWRLRGSRTTVKS